MVSRSASALLALLASWAPGGARELDPAACGARFDVQRDKIIRTEESRDMGARYLSELDVGARHECLRLCCETDGCDVFVYEEKGPGSCYLFTCGPPEDFRCKFTAHSNFSSGVLALSRRLAELQDQERLAQRERELASLRSVASSTTPPAPSSPAAPPVPAAPPSHGPLTEAPPAGACSRYQFACRRGGECVAVYNACDGVPQCADGSDEAPELGCPPPPPPPPASRAPPPPRARTAPPPPTPQQEADGAEAAQRWPHRLAQAQPPRRFDETPHIFSHKGGLLQEPERGAVQFPPFEPWPRRAWPAAPGPALPPPGAESMAVDRGWGGGGGGGGPGGPYSRGEWLEPDPRRAWPVPQPRPEQEMPVYVPAKTMPEVPGVYSSRQQTLRDGPKKGLELPKAAEAEAPTPPPLHPGGPPLVENATDKKVIKENRPPVNTAEHAARRHFAADEHDGHGEHDGLSERPPAAVLLLVLGLALTAATGAMLACRVRASRRRLRRGKSPFAHDADYLVNGMYL